MSAPLPWLVAPFEALRRRKREGNLPHALLIAAEPGHGADALASGVVATIACREPHGPCGRCDGCARYAAGQHPDHRFVTLELNEDTGKLRKEISVDQVRALIAELQQTSLMGGWKSAVLDPAECMSNGAANALLKTLEEPPAATLLVLVTARPDRLAATLRSRCQAVTIPRPDRRAARAWLEAQAPRPDWDLWLAVAGGAPLAAQELAASPFAPRRAAVAQALLGLPEGRGDPLRLAGELADQDPRAFVRWWESVVRDLIVLRQAGGDDLRNPDLAAAMRNLGPRLHLASLHRFIQALQHARRALEATNVTPALLVQSLLVAWAAALAPETMRALAFED
jgi:DNA polymerase-3 subunit delta'